MSRTAKSPARWLRLAPGWASRRRSRPESERDLGGPLPETPRSSIRVLLLVTLVSLGVGVIGAATIMVRVCTDAKSAAPQNHRQLPFFIGLPPVLDIAHRGASKLAPEHSLGAYQLALDQGAHVLEIDLRLLRDRELVIAHDRTLRRTHGVDTAYAELDWAALEAITGARAPLRLGFVLGHFPTVRFNLELKDEAPEAAQVLADVIGATGAGGRVLVASSHETVLAAFREATAGGVATSASTAEALRYYFCFLMQRTCDTPYSALQLPATDWLGITGPAFIAGAHERGLAVHYWTVDDPAKMRALLAAGADGIMTNRPDVLARLLPVR